MQIAVAVAEGQEVLRRGLGVMLDAAPGVSWRAYRTLDDAVTDAVDTGWATVCLVELGELCDTAGDPRPRLAPTPVVATVPSADPVVLRLAVHAAADGYVLLPDLSVETLHAALRDVAGGRRHLPEAISSFLLTWAQTGGPRLDEPTQLLSPRERDVLALLVDGLSNKEISARLAISVHGVKRHVSSMLSKLNSPSRSHLVSSVLRAEADARPALAFTRTSR